RGQPLGHGCLPGQPLDRLLAGRPLTVTVTPLARRADDHRNAEPGYVPSRRLQHLIRARTRTCSAPGCRCPAWRCDLDHTVPYASNGLTCDCNLAPLCRHHHRCKQSEGWRLEQPAPGTMRWTTPAGRRYVTVPDAYP
ncbi:MAG TPA: HNH endonuclease signature motif containing protein, partial [Streptosporangiaceae bacterium]|nr:HNH endonuclease signature motif containing protein [Streptosporangiaceae bacterium]